MGRRSKRQESGRSAVETRWARDEDGVSKAEIAKNLERLKELKRRRGQLFTREESGVSQCWEIFCVPKMATGVGPFMWIPLKGQELTARKPSELDVFDINKGQQSGVNSWPGLQAVTARFMTDYWPNSVWMNHACSECRRDVTIEGTVHPIQACCLDGCTSGRWFKVLS
eukprot:g7645.t2